MPNPDQAPIREAQEESEDGSAEVNVEEAEKEESGASLSHLPLAPTSELPDTTTVDPSYVISLIRKLLPNTASGQIQPQNVTCSLYSVEEKMVGDPNYQKKLTDEEANNNSISHSIANDEYKEEATGFDDHKNGFFDEENAWEESGCILWDLSASRFHAEFMVNNFILEVLLASLQASKTPRVTEICLGIFGNLACHDVAINAMTSKDGLIETVVDQLYLDDSPCLLETLRLLTVALQSSGSSLWAKALLSEQICLRIIWIVGNTLNTRLLEKSIEFLFIVITNEEVKSILLRSWIELGLPDLVMNLLSCEMSNFDDENKPQRTTFLDPVLSLVEALSTTDCGIEVIFPNEELCNLVCRVIKLPDKYEYASSCVSAIMIIANLLVDGQHISSRLSQDHEFLKGLLLTIPFVSDDSQARNALWCTLDRLLVQITEKDIDVSSLCHLVALFLEKSHLIMDDLDSHYMEYTSSLNGSDAGAIVRTLLRIACIIEVWFTRKNEKVEETGTIADSQVKAERLLHYCKKYGSVLSIQNGQE